MRQFKPGDSPEVVSVLVNNEMDVLARLVTLFTRRGYNIESLKVEQVGNPDMSCVKIEMYGAENDIAQMIRQTRKLVDVLDVSLLEPRCAFRESVSVAQ